MKFTYYKYEQLPRLSWCAVMEKGKGNIDVYCGPWVETFENFFVEGVWDNDFEKGNFDESIFFMGSGGIIKESEIIFSTPCHTLESLYLIRNNQKVYISNSLAFVLEMSNNDLDINYLNYEKDFASILDGIKDYKSVIPLKKGKNVELLYFCNIICDKNLNIKKERKRVRKDFINFEDYYNSICNTLKSMKENANSKNRKIKYGIVTTISKGYDSAACAALGKEIGCDCAVTLNKPKKYAEDDGTDIAQMLGYNNIIKGDADSYLRRKDLVEAEFLSSGELGTGIFFSAFEKYFEKNMVLTGTNGDLFWSKKNDFVNREIKYSNESIPSISFYENRLRVGFVNIPIPFYGALNWPSIYKISNAKEMRNWSIGNDYDKPIPRRILEERGVPRTAFGISKKGAGFNYQYDNLNRIKKRMSPTSFESFYSFYKKNKSIKRQIKNLNHIIKFIFNSFPVYFNYLINKLGIDKSIEVNLNKLVSNPFSPSYLIHWGLHITKQRYDLKNIRENQEILN